MRVPGRFHSLLRLPPTLGLVLALGLLLAVSLTAAERPLVAITGYVDEPGARDDPGWGQFRLIRSYSDGVLRAGGLPVHAVPVPDLSVGALLDRVDGVLLTGGPDVDPARYGEERHPSVNVVPRERGDFDMALAREAMRREMPILGICLGSQVLNVARGGSLIQDLPSAVPGAGDRHSYLGPESMNHPQHEVALIEGTPLASLYDRRVIDVNTAHHQAVKTLGEGLVAAARCPVDGVIEGFYLPGHPFLLGVQYHPERQQDPSTLHDRLFEAFVRACETYRRTERGEVAEPPAATSGVAFDDDLLYRMPGPGSRPRMGGR